VSYRYRVPPYAVLSPGDVELLHQASLDILATIGVRVPNGKILDLAVESGAKVDRATEVVKLPPELVTRAISQVGKTHVLYGRDRGKAAEFGHDRFNFNGSSGQHQVLDWENRKRRRPTVADLREAIAVGEALETINITGSLVVPSDVPDGTADVISFYELLAGTTKPFTSWVFDGNTASIVIEMMRIAAGGTAELRRFPFFEAFIEPVSPLGFRKDSLEILERFVDAGLPVGISPMVQAGATGPCSLAGTLAQENAEVLAGITIVQLLAPGHPVTYGGIAHIFDMKVGGISFGSPEQGLLAAATTQLGRHYGFPIYANAGLTDSKALDAQYGIECAATLALAGLAHADIFGHLGICGADSAADLVQLVVDDEAAAYFTRVFSGFTVSPQTISLQEIAGAGIGGNFLSSEMTAEKYRKEFWFPRLMDRSSWDAWEKEGKTSISQRAQDRLRKLLSKRESPAMDSKMAKELEHFLAARGIPMTADGGKK
jgi:trimethylamine---corrinoid protein Co-methyltransferase